MKSIMALVLILLIGCDSKRISDDPLDIGIQKIDRGDYDGAIVYLGDLSNRDGRPEVQIALATAYVGRAGVQFSDYWELIQDLRRNPITTEKILQSSSYLENKERVEPVAPYLPGQYQENLDQLFQMVSAFDLYRQKVEILPYVPEEKRPDLQNGISVLSQNPNPGGRFYRAVLIATLLRSDLEDGFDVWESIEQRLEEALRYPLQAPEVFCSPLTGNFVDWLQARFEYAASVTDDLQAVFPSDAEQYEAFGESVEELQSEIPDVQETLVPRGCP